MSRRSRHRRQQEAQAPVERTGVKPIKLVAVGIGIVLLIVAAAGFLTGAFASGSPATSGASPNQATGALAPSSGGVQEVAVSMQGYQYQPNPIRVKVGVPVKFTVDLNTVRGCMRSIQIPELGMSGRVSEGNNVITFTPSKAGTFRMTCSMGMADGTIIVEDANGQAPPAAPQPARPLGGGSCGAGGGGCGCGG